MEDARRTADVLRPMYDGTDGRHGFVSLEVSPYLAHDTEGTIEEARRVLEQLDELEIDIDAVTQQLEDEGVDKFSASYDQVIEALGQKQPVAA